MAFKNDKEAIFIRSLDYVCQFKEITNIFEIVEKKGEGSFSSVFTVRRKTINPDHSDDEDEKHLFALKMIIPTVDVRRIENELRIMKHLGGQRNIIKLHSAMRIRDHVFLMMPYFEHARFSSYFLQMDEDEIRFYVANLLEALAYLHKYGIVHRDVKPSNFLYDRSQKRFALVDFGLSHLEGHGDVGPWWDPSNISVPSVAVSPSNSPDCTKTKRSLPTKSVKRLSSVCAVKGTSERPVQRPSIENISPVDIVNDNGSSSKKGRKKCSCVDNGKFVSICRQCRHLPPATVLAPGTLGYRPPEVMWRSSQSNMHTSAIDVWAVGVILLTFLTSRFPFFQVSNDCEITHCLLYLLGNDLVKDAAHKLGFKIVSNPTPDYTFDGKDEMAALKHFTKQCRYIRKNNDRLSSETDVVLNASYRFQSSAYDFAFQLLCPNYLKRITAEEGLRHEFTANYLHPPMELIQSILKMVFGFGGSKKASETFVITRDQLDIRIMEMKMVQQVFTSLMDQCMKKCLDDRFSEGELSKAESVCLDRCASKYEEVHKMLDKTFQDRQQEVMRQQQEGAK